MRRAALGCLFLASGLLLMGCAHYEYRVVQPAGSAQVITKEGITVQYDPLEYKMADRGGRVAMRIMNPTETPMRIIGDRSWVVDPKGASHPVRAHMIAPHSFVDSSLPPHRQYYYGAGYPVFGYYGYGAPWYNYWGYDSYYYSPWSYSYQVVTPFDWNWNCEGQVRLHMSYGHGGEQNRDQVVEHDIVIERRKLK